MLMVQQWHTEWMPDDTDSDASRLAADSLSRNDPTGWFERLYLEAETGSAVVPWDRDVPTAAMVEWLAARGIDTSELRALVVGCGYGMDAEHVGSCGYRTTAFDISPTAISASSKRFPGSAVRYVVADVLDPPHDWIGSFDLVVESITVQSMPLWVRERAIASIASMVAPGGTLLVISGFRGEGEVVEGPPWPLSRSEIELFASSALTASEIDAESGRWTATFERSR